MADSATQQAGRLILAARAILEAMEGLRYATATLHADAETVEEVAQLSGLPLLRQTSGSEGGLPVSTILSVAVASGTCRVSIQGSRAATEDELAGAVVYGGPRPPTDDERRAAMGVGHG